jgi:8-oxo-dGTP diphosphatase
VRFVITPIVGTLGFVLSPDRANVLMVHRIARLDDESLGKWNGLGGKVEIDEDVATGMIRELREEAAIEVVDMTLRGTVLWPNFGRNGEDWLGFVFVVTGFDGDPPDSNDEGALAWVPVEDVVSGVLPMWPGDQYFLPLVFDGDPRQFHGVMPYEGGEPTAWRFWRG